MAVARRAWIVAVLLALVAAAAPARAAQRSTPGGWAPADAAGAHPPAPAVLAASAAAAGADEPPLPPGLEADAQGMHPDPLAPFNEPLFVFNRWLDDWVLRPVAKGYGWVTPEPVRHAVTRFFENVDVIHRVVNNLLQLRFERAGVETARFGINTTIGVAGFFDPAQSWLDLEPAPNDFGLTCRIYGIPGGPYLMLPFFGPSTVTDAAGRVVDWFMNPIPWLIPFYASVAVSTTRNAFEAVNYRSLHLDQFAEVDRYVVDLYGAVQDFYLQSRAQKVAELREGAREREDAQREAPRQRVQKPGRWRRVR